MTEERKESNKNSNLESLMKRSSGSNMDRKCNDAINKPCSSNSSSRGSCFLSLAGSEEDSEDNWFSFPTSPDLPERNHGVDVEVDSKEEDDVSKEQSFSMNSQQHGGPAPLCPICYEDLDETDWMFLPCSCGFHLCLFCHKRILEEDGRCPCCRKKYSIANWGG